MSSYHELIGEAMLGDNRRAERAEARLTCKMVASHQMTCPECGGILDQSRVFILEQYGGPLGDADPDFIKGGPVKWIGGPGRCGDCWTTVVDQLPGMAAYIRQLHPGTGLRVVSWSGFETL